MNFRKFLGVLFLLSLFPHRSFLTAQILEAANIRVLLLVEYDGEEDNVPLQSVITDSVSLEFTIRNLDVLVVEPEDLDALSSGDEDPLAALERRSRSSYVMHVLYSVDKGKVELKTECLRISDSSSLLKETFKVPVGLSLDDEIQQEVSGYIDRIEADIQENPDLMTYLVYEEEKDSAPASFPVPGITTTFTFFMPLGESMDYLGYGINPRIRAHYPLPLSFGEIGFGWSVSVNSVSAEGELNTSRNIFTSTGPDILLKWNFLDRYYLYAGLSGGMCIWMVNRNSEGYQGVLLPGLIADAGAGWAYNDWIHLVLGADYSLYFEESLNIMGISPSLGVYLNL